MNRTVVFSTMVYALGKDLGLVDASAEWTRQASDKSAAELPAARMLHRVRELLPDVTLGVHADIAATSIPRSRSRAFHAAKGADFWFACDDDVEATIDAVAAMLAAADVLTPRIVFLPCKLRGRDVVGVKFSTRAMESAHNVRPIESSATCAYVANGPALRVLADTCQHLRYRDDDGVPRLALFHEILDGGEWLGEDVSFCVRAALCGIELVAVTTGTSAHDGQILKLDLLR
jgi:hypothetical protein